MLGEIVDDIGGFVQRIAVDEQAGDLSFPTDLDQAGLRLPILRDVAEGKLDTCSPM